MNRIPLFFIAFLALNASAEDAPPPVLTPCGSQIDLYCANERDSKDFRNLLRCLMKNDDKLTPLCKQEIQRFAKASQQTSPPGAGPLGALGSLIGVGGQVPALAYEGRSLPSSGSGRGVSLLENAMTFSLPLFKQEGSTLSLSAVASNTHLGEKIVLDSGTPLSSDFHRTEMGLHFSHALPELRSWGVRGSFGFTGDAFDSRTTSYSLSANYSFPSSSSSRWVFMILMSNNGSLGAFIPLPGFFYIYRTPTFTGVFGLPILSLQWTPIVPWSLSFSAFGPQLRSEISYGAIDQTQIFAGLAWKQQRYITASRVNEDDRLTIDEKNSELGIRQPLFQGVLSEVSGGFAFDRSISIGKGLFNHDRGEAKLSSAFYARWAFKAVF